MLNRNIIFPSIIIFLSAIAFALVTQFDKPRYQDASVDATFFPMVIAIAQIVLCLVLIFQHINKKRNKLQVKK
ncbi:hypothetical protein ACLKMH_21155 [Psychromonas sp. KJ10-10]|uniref:hypothetical protein n=1 Tax=Psychromonas sp. KJ10-10 TaxID=3391823 RepID=UPI0039B4213F